MKKILVLLVVFGLGGGGILFLFKKNKERLAGIVEGLADMQLPVDPYKHRVKELVFVREKGQKIEMERDHVWDPNYDSSTQLALAKREQVADQLIAVLANKSAPVKQRIGAALVLGHSRDITERRDEFLNALVPLLSDEGERVAELTAFAIGKLVHPKAAYAKCGEVLASAPAETARYYALIAIRDTRDATSRKVYDDLGTKAVLAAFDDKSPRVRALAAVESQHIMAKDDTEKMTVVDKLFKLVADSDAAVSDAATDSLRRRVEDIPKDILGKETICLEILALPQAHAKRNAIRCVTYLNDAATSSLMNPVPPTLKLYEEALKSGDIPAPALAALAKGLGKYGSDAEARTVAEWLGKSADPDVADGVLEGLRARVPFHKNQRTPAVLGVLAEAAKQPEGPAKLAALRALGAHGARDEARMLLDLLKAGATDPVKTALLDGLKGIAGDVEKIGEKPEDWEIWFKKKYKEK